MEPEELRVVMREGAETMVRAGMVFLPSEAGRAGGGAEAELPPTLSSWQPTFSMLSPLGDNC